MIKKQNENDKGILENTSLSKVTYSIKRLALDADYNEQILVFQQLTKTIRSYVYNSHFKTLSRLKSIRARDNITKTK